MFVNVHACFAWRTAALLEITGRAGSRDILPGRSAAGATRHHMIEGQVLVDPQYWQANLSRRKRLNRVKAGCSLGRTYCLSAITEGMCIWKLGEWTSRS